MSEGYNEMTDKMKIHYLSTNALEKISTMLKQGLTIRKSVFS